MDRAADPWSATRFDVYEHLRDRREQGAGVMATVVNVAGSAYRRPGAKLVVADDSHVGAITAGCLEGPLLELARDVRESGEPRVETYDMTDDDEWGIGLGCNGVIDVLLEPIDDSLDVALAELAAKRPATLVTVVDGGTNAPLGARATITVDGAVHGAADRPDLPETLLDRIRPVAEAAMSDGSSTTLSVTVDGEEVTVFVDGLQPVTDLVVFGNQNDVHPVSRLASQVGFRVVVASARGAKSDPDSFPDADAVRSVRAPDLASVVDADEYTAVVLMSHNFVDDRLALESVLRDTEVPYVGLMGPRKRFERMHDELAEEGVTLDRDDLDRIATPVGLDLGGGEPVEIATSIVAEVLAVTNDRPGGRLTDSAEPIHPRTGE